MNNGSTDSVDRPRRAYPLVILAVLLFSVSPILVRFASGAPGISVAALRTIFAALVVLPVALLRSSSEIRSFKRNDWFLIVTAGVLLAGHFVTWIEALYHTTVSSASVLVASSPIVLALLGYFILKERLTPIVLLAVMGGVAGAVVLGLGDHGASVATAGNASFGNALALTAACLFSVYFIIGRIVRQSTSWLGYVGPLYFVVAVATVSFALLRGATLLGFEPKIYVLCALMGIGPQIIGHGSFNYAVKYFSPTLLGLFGLMEPVGATLYAFLLFGEVPTVVSFIGTAILLGSVAVALIASDRGKVPESA
ncbi:MAG: DMT family transporter [Rhodothermales bacterium]|nr:DMT family transporter [Rhodothermales bacterium]